MCSNVYKEGDFVGFGKSRDGGGNQIGNELFNWTVPVLWKQIQQDSNYEQRKQAVEDFNRNNQWKKKGIAISTCRWDANPANIPKNLKKPTDPYGPAYTVGAHVAVYSDGSVMVASGGVEMGQGLNTKVAQAAAYQLGCPLEKIVVGEGNSHILPNSGVTGGSNTSENCVYAMIDACKIISKTLHPYRAEGGTWDDVIAKATADSVINKTGLLATAWNTGGWDLRTESERAR